MAKSRANLLSRCRIPSPLDPSCIEQLLVELSHAPQRPPYLPRLVGDGRGHIGEKESLSVPTAADHDLATRVHDVAVAVTNPVRLRDRRILPEHHVVATHEVNAVLHGTGHMVGPDMHEVADQPFLADVVEVRRKNNPGSLQGEDAARLDVAA